MLIMLMMCQSLNNHRKVYEAVFAVDVCFCQHHIFSLDFTVGSKPEFPSAHWVAVKQRALAWWRLASVGQLALMYRQSHQDNMEDVQKTDLCNPSRSFQRNKAVFQHPGCVAGTKRRNHFNIQPGSYIIWRCTEGTARPRENHASHFDRFSRL